jgi:Zn-dependent M28 family amino/carboxypeptidase
MSGHAEIAPGVRLVNRSTVSNRQAARQYLTRLLVDMGLAALEQNYGTGTNVYAELKGTSGARAYVVVGAHFDSVAPSPGANDNATGVAAVLAVARYVTSLPCRSKHFYFVLFDEEEVGLVGSKNFATKLKTDGAVVHSVHTIDQMGWDSNGDRLIELELPDMGLEDLYRAAVAELGVSIPIKPTKTASTDHSSFRPTFLATGVTEGYTSGDTTPYYHKAGDTYETVDFAYLKSTTVLVNRVMSDLSR